MMTCLVSLLLAAIGVIAVRPLLRRTFSAPAVATAAAPTGEVALELPAELEDLPEPPVLQKATVEILESAEIYRRLRELELGVSKLGKPRGDH